MPKHPDTSGQLSWQDALQHWKEVEREYNLSIKLERLQVLATARGFQLSGFISWSEYKSAGGSGKKNTRVVEYPNRNSRTFPGTLVHHLSAIALECERAKLEAARRLEQLPMFGGVPT